MTHAQDVLKAATAAHAEALEEMVDVHGLGRVLGMLADVCNEKAEHVRSVWGDKEGGRAWERDAALLLKLAPKLEN